MRTMPHYTHLHGYGDWVSTAAAIRPLYPVPRRGSAFASWLAFAWMKQHLADTPTQPGGSDI